MSKYGYLEVRISRSVSEDPFEFEITRVDCKIKFLKRSRRHLLEQCSLLGLIQYVLIIQTVA